MTPDELAAIKARCEAMERPVVVRGYDPHCTCGSLVPECKPCRTVRGIWEERRFMMAKYYRTDLPLVIADLEAAWAEIAELRAKAEALERLVDYPDGLDARIVNYLDKTLPEEVK